MEKEEILKITDSHGNTMEYEVITAFSLPKEEKNIVVYTDNTKNEDGTLNVFASIYYPGEEPKLENIEKEEDWEIVEEILNNLPEKE